MNASLVAFPHILKARHIAIRPRFNTSSVRTMARTARLPAYGFLAGTSFMTSIVSHRTQIGSSARTTVSRGPVRQDGRVRVFVAEDQYLLRQGLVRLLQSHEIEIVGEADSADGLVEAIESSDADVALLDIRMPPTNTDEGIQAALELRRRTPQFPVLLLSQYVERLYLDELLGDEEAGMGYLLKDRVFDDVSFIAALRNVAAGGIAVDPEAVQAMLDQRPLDRLTPREREVLGLMAEGWSNPVIAERLFITDKAVQKHINSIFMKLDLPSADVASRRVQAVLAFLRR